MGQFIKNKSVIITGASSGIGAACARVFGMAGAQLVLAARRTERLKALTEELKGEGVSCTYIATDVVKANEVESMVKHTLESYGRIDVLINNAGVGCVGRMADINPSLVRQVFDINFFGALDCIQAVVPEMRKQGSGLIMNVSSVIGKRSIPDIGSYCATKFALNAISDAMRLELRAKGIDVVTVCPGYTESEFSENQLRPKKSRPFVANFPKQSATKVAKTMLKAAKKRPREIHLTFSGKMLVNMERISPWLTDQVLALRSKFTNY